MALEYLSSLHAGTRFRSAATCCATTARATQGVRGTEFSFNSLSICDPTMMGSTSFEPAALPFPHDHQRKPTSIPRAFQRLQVQRGSSAVQATGRCGAANEKRHAAEACRRMPTASRTLMIVERLGLPSALSARYKLAAESRISCDLAHPPSAGDISECTRNASRIFRCFGEPCLEVCRHLLRRAQLRRDVVTDRLRLL